MLLSGKRTLVCDHLYFIPKIDTFLVRDTQIFQVFDPSLGTEISRSLKMVLTRIHSSMNSLILNDFAIFELDIK